MSWNARSSLFVLMMLGSPGGATAADSAIRIGVLSHRGEEITQRIWAPTADYLSAALPGYEFQVLPLPFSAVEPAVATQRVDFILVNPGIYVNLEVRHRVSRIATLNNRLGEVPRNQFGGVLFTRAERTDMRTLKDLRGSRFMAVDRTSLGGFQMAWGELQTHHLDPQRDFAELQFAGTHDRVVLAIRDGRADVGTVRTDILERMAKAGSIDLEDYRVLNPQDGTEFPFLRSTPLYPEWPFSKVRQTPNELAQQVAIALLRMPLDHPASLAGQYAGWTIPLDYQPVHDLLRALQLPPYDQLGRFTLSDAIERYWFGLLLGLLSLLIMVFLTLSVLRLNQRLARAKRHLEQRHELILNSVADGIYGVDLAGKATFVNRAMERITGWSERELIGQNQHRLLHHSRADGSPHPDHECPVYATSRDNRPRYVDDDVFWKRDGTPLPVEYSANPIQNNEGNTVGSVVVFRDITERKLMAERMRQHQLELAHVARLSTLGEMASGIAHELNQPLTAITTNARACVRMLESGRSSRERCSDVMEKIARQADRAGEVIRQIRLFVRKEQPDSRPVALSAILDAVMGLLQPDARREGVTLSCDAVDGGLWVLAQDIQIEQVILNLARNAIEAMAETPAGRRHLSLQARASIAGRVEIRVTDTGPGLTRELAERIFQPFVTTKPQGLGLGLSISQGIVEAHGGQLRVESDPGAGATFSFTLPLCEEAMTRAS